MADLKISAASAASALTGAESLAGLQSGGPVRPTPAQIRDYVLGPQSGRNIAGRNGSFEVAQRGASRTVAASATNYTIDGWYLATGANEASTVTQETGLVAASRYAGRVRRDDSQTGTAVMRFAYPLDEVEVLRLRGEKLMLSFRVQAAAGFSPASGTLSYAVYTGTGASPAKRNATPYTGEVALISGSVNLTAGGAAVQVISAISAAAGASVGQAEIQFSWTPVGTASDDHVTIDDVQLEAVPATATVWTPVYDRRLFGDEWGECRRHLFALASGAAGTPLAGGLCYSTTAAQVAVPMSPPLRAAPAAPALSAAGDWQLLSSVGSGVAATAITYVTNSRFCVNLNVTVAAGLTGGDATQLQSGATGAVIAISAEI